jgi:Fe-S cluster assembly protein SufD
MTQVAERAEQAYLSDYERLASRQASIVPGWLGDLRAAGAGGFAAVGFPTTRDEEWRHTSVAPLAAAKFTPAPDHTSAVTRDAIDRFLPAGADATVLAFVNGHVAPHLSTPSTDVTVERLANVMAQQPELARAHLGRYAAVNGHPFAALNTAFVDDGAFVSIARGVIVPKPIHLLFLSTAAGAATVSHPRVLVLAGEHSQATIVETYAGLDDGVYFTNAVSEIVVGSAAVVDHYKVQRESARAYHIGAMFVHGDRTAVFSSHSIAMGAAIARNDVVAVLGGEGIDCTLNGVYFVDGDRLVDTHTTIDHAMPHCGSHEVYKGILADKGRAVFNGKIVVRPDAQKTDAKQTNKALLLSDEATINTKPQLEIFADDVKCTHGAAIGQLDEDAIFYLRARGIGLHDARNMLVHAFVGEILDRVKIEPLRTGVEQDLFAMLPELA